MRFVKCAGREACTDDGTYCRGCGRSHAEIHRTRELTGALTEFIVEAGYENPEAFLAHVQEKVLKKLKAATTPAGPAD